MCVSCMSFHVLVLICPLVLVEFCYSQTVRSDGRMPKCLQLHWTDATGWLLFRPGVGVGPIMVAGNLVLYLKLHWVSVPWNSLWPLLLHFYGVCLVVISLAAFCTHPVLLSSGFLTLHFPVCAFSELFFLFIVLASLICTIMWVPHPCNYILVWLVSHCCQFLPSPWCVCCLIVIVLVTALSIGRWQCSLLHTSWFIRYVPCVLVVSMF